MSGSLTSKEPWITLWVDAMTTTSAEERQLLLALFDKSILKQAKHKAITDLLPETQGKRCLDVGADNGVLSYLLRQRGGEWYSADLNQEVVASIEKMVGENVCLVTGDQIQFEDGFFDLVVIIDALEHIPSDHDFVAELSRVMAPDGTLIVNVPHHKPVSPIRWLRLAVGLTDEKHGHVRPGYTLKSLRATLAPYFVIEQHDTYSRFFVELFDVVVSLFFDLTKRNSQVETESSKGNVVTGADMRKHAKKFKLFSILYPFVWVLAQLDRLLFFTSGYSLIVRARPMSATD